MTRKAADIRRRELFDITADQGLIREAGQRRQAVGAMFKWAVAQDILDANPAEGTRLLRHEYAAGSRAGHGPHYRIHQAG